MKKFSLFLFYFLSINLYAEECNREWIGTSPNSDSIIGLGTSSLTDSAEAKSEATKRAFQEIVQQLQSNVNSQSTLSETMTSQNFSNAVKVESGLEGLVGLKLIKEGQNKAQGVSHCSAYTFDVRAAYDNSNSKVSSIYKSVSKIEESVKNKKYIDLILFYSETIKTIRDNQVEILRADIYKTFLKIPGPTWFEKIKNIETEIEKAYNESKSIVVFYLEPNAKHEIALSEIESFISSKGFNVIGKNDPKLPFLISISLKEAGQIRKSNTALGITLTANISVTIRDLKTMKLLGTNKGSSVVGTGQTEEDAQANIERQLVAHIIKSIKDAVPGLITE